MASNRQHYVQLRLRLFCSMTRAAVSAVHTKVHQRSIWFCCQKALRTMPRKRLKRKNCAGEKRHWDTDQGVLRTYKTGGSYKRKKLFLFFASKMPRICFRKVYYLSCIIQYSEKHRSFCFIIRHILLTQILNVNLYCGLHLPENVKGSYWNSLDHTERCSRKCKLKDKFQHI